MKVRIPHYTSAYRKGERTGTVVNTGWLKELGADKRGSRRIARVQLDNSKKTILVDLGDCAQIEGDRHDHPVS